MDEKEVLKRLANIGPSIRAHRKNAGFTLSTLSKESGVSTSMISQLERNVTVPSLKTLVRLAAVLGVEYTDLLLTEVVETQYKREARPRQLPETPEVPVANGAAEAYHAEVTQ